MKRPYLHHGKRYTWAELLLIVSLLSSCYTPGQIEHSFRACPVQSTVHCRAFKRDVIIAGCLPAQQAQDLICKCTKKAHKRQPECQEIK